MLSAIHRVCKIRAAYISGKKNEHNWTQGAEEEEKESNSTVSQEQRAEKKGRGERGGQRAKGKREESKKPEITAEGSRSTRG